MNRKYHERIKLNSRPDVIFVELKIDYVLS